LPQPDSADGAGPAVVVIVGGGTGLSVLLRGLKTLHVHRAGGSAG
jgi:2-phospho-L-lactate transferase/gluconeogenesis factor (CofD/UPF0052 family)